MRLYKKLSISGQDYIPVSEDISLHYNRSGRAIIQVQAKEELKGEVSFALGWNFESEMTLYFSGDVERSVRVDAKQQRLFCREISARLNAPHPLALRHPSLKDVLDAYAARTGISFILPERPYASVKVPAFYGVGSGFHGLDSVGGVFGIEDYHWQAQGDGKVFVGAWADSRWKDRAVDVPREFFTAQLATDNQTIAAIPALRPGAVVNGRRLYSLRFSGHQMTLGFAHA